MLILGHRDYCDLVCNDPKHAADLIIEALGVDVVANGSIIGFRLTWQDTDTLIEILVDRVRIWNDEGSAAMLMSIFPGYGWVLMSTSNVAQMWRQESC